MKDSNREKNNSMKWKKDDKQNKTNKEKKIEGINKD